MGMFGVRKVSDPVGVSRTVAAERDKTDIRAILAKAKRTGGAVAFMSAKQGFYSDISDAPTYMDALSVVARGKQQFDLLPAVIRDRFANDPARFLAFMSDEANSEEIVKMGLRAPPVVPAIVEPVSVRVISDPVAK